MVFRISTVKNSHLGYSGQYSVQFSHYEHGGNSRIFLPLRFYVKSILENLEVLKVAVFAFLGALNSDFGSFSAFKKSKIS